MKYNNWEGKGLAIFVVTIILLAVGSNGKGAHKRVKMIQDLPQIVLESTNDKWFMHMQISHHNLKLGVGVNPGRSWIKQALCQLCNREGQNCKGKQSCFQSLVDPKISCDSAFCSKSGQYESQQQGIYGIDVQMFCKVGKDQQALMPLVLANKIVRNITTMGQFNIMDSQSSFDHGLLILEDHKLKITNMKIQKERVKEIKDFSFDVKEVKVSQEEFGFGRGKTIKVKNQEIERFKQITLPETTGFPINFSVEQLGIIIPNKLLHILERQLLALYFPNNKCHFNSGKIKCRDDLEFGGLTSAILQFQLESGSVISLPVHLLLGSCTARECNFLLDKHGQQKVVIGSIIWETLALEWNLQSRQIFLYRLNNSWSKVYAQFSQLESHRSFLANLLLLIYHIFKYIVLTLLWLAVVSLLINCMFKWKEALLFIRGIIVKLRGQKKEVIDQDQDTIGHVFERSGRGRRIHRLPDELEDEI